MGRIKELLLEDENTEENENSSYIDELEYEVNELKEQYDNLKNKDKSKENIDEIKDVIDEMIDELDSIIDRIINISSEIQDNLSEYESTSNDLELSIKKYDEALASNQCLIEDGTYQECELYKGIEDDSREDYESEQETIIDLIKDTEEQLEKIEEFKEEVEKFKEEVEELNEEIEQILENEIEEENNTETESKVIQLKNNIVKEESNPEQKGEEGELAFKEWLQNNNFSFLYIKQDKAAFAHMFHNALKRPDFLVLVDGIGLIAIDVKNNKCYQKKYFSLPIERELKRTLAFERTFRLPVWYVYSNCQKYDKWYWINSLKVVEVGKMIVNNSTNKSFYSIPKNDCIEIVTNEDFGKLWTHRFSSLKPINKLDLNT